MTVTAADFWVPKEKTDPWGSRVVDVIDRVRLTALVSAPDSEHSDLDVALALMDLVRDDFQLSETSGDSRISDGDMRLAVRALERTSARASHDFCPPFRDHAAWRAYWIRKGASGGWLAGAAGDLLGDLFDAPYAAMMAAQDRALESTLAEAASPHERLGWHEVDTEMGELRRHFRSARTPQDYRAVGLDCVAITEALSRQVYDHTKYTPDGEAEPPFSQTKLRLDRYVQARLAGAGNAEMRKMARAVIELAQAVKHGRTPTRTEAGVLADAVILLANMLRRLEEEQEE